MYELSITIRALRVIDLHNGEFRIELRGEPLSEADLAMLRRLFPNTCERAHELLHTEALLASIIPPGFEAPEPGKPAATKQAAFKPNAVK